MTTSTAQPTTSPSTTSQTTGNETESTANITQASTTSVTQLSTSSSDSYTSSTVTTPVVTNGSTQDTAAKPTEPNDTGGSNYSPIVGGVVGGVVAVVIVIVVVLFVYRRRKRRNAPNKRKAVPPNIDQLNAVEKSLREGNMPPENPEHAEPTNDKMLYQNVDAKGGPNEHTDPALSHDGYLKSKSKQTGDELYCETDEHRLLTDDAFENGDNGNGVDNSSFKREHTYVNGDNSNKQSGAKAPGNLKAKQAPAHTDLSVSYHKNSNDPQARGHAKTFSEQDSNPKSCSTQQKQDYVNLQQQGKGNAVFGIKPKGKQKKKQIQNESSNAPPFVGEGKYANVNVEASKPHYANVGNKTMNDVELDIYENT